MLSEDPGQVNMTLVNTIDCGDLTDGKPEVEFFSMIVVQKYVTGYYLFQFKEDEEHNDPYKETDRIMLTPEQAIAIIKKVEKNYKTH